MIHIDTDKSKSVVNLSNLGTFLSVCLSVILEPCSSLRLFVHFAATVFIYKLGRCDPFTDEVLVNYLLVKYQVICIFCCNKSSLVFIYKLSRCDPFTGEVKYLLLKYQSIYVYKKN